MIPSSENIGYLEKIDVIRAIACLLVFLLHAAAVIMPNLRPVYDGAYLDYQSMPLLNLILTFSPFSFGGTGVQLFLLVSGFLIHYGYLKKAKALDIPEYINRRFWRIYPAYLVVMLFCAFAVKQDVSSWDIVSHLLLIHNLNEETFFSINPVLWSMGLEFQLYLLFPIFLYLRKRVGINYTILLLAILAFGFTWIGHDNLVIHVSPMCMWVIWGMGAWLAEMYLSGKMMPRLNRWKLAALLLVVISIKVLSFNSIVYPYAFACFYLVAIWSYLTRPELKLNLLTEFIYKVTVWFGLISYSVYLLHVPFLAELLNYFSSRDLYGFAYPSAVSWVVTRVVAMIVVLVIISGISYSLYTFIELESGKWGRFFYNRFVKPYRYKIESEKEHIKV